MKCENCGRELSLSDKVCMECGNPVLKDETAAATADVVESPPVQQQGNESALPVEVEADEGKSSNEYVEKTVEISKNYWGFILENLKAPTKRGFENTSKDFIFGYINIFLISLFLGLGMFFQIRGSLGPFGSMVGIGFWNVFPSVLLFTLAAFVVGAAVIFGALKLISKVNVSFHDIVGRFGTLITLCTLLAAAYFIISILGVTMLTGFILLLLIAGAQIAVILTLNSYQESAQGTLDPIYTIFITYAVYFIYLGLTAQMILETVISNLIPFGF
ncbi:MULTISPECIES: zinc ribbon domain-containing protein [Bacillaceae]|uniref:Zinc ribbon domain-containing protein n=1 Tax=Evansella alkalicola TaxID=745819 RepID=A0ABS6JSL0_9BACI|nr:MULTISPECIES: zinc ribbon domain-containing protein [Bacillaceae]MBU9721551.1 zinc ribbon domain-containing protein [Bacillus alkalicola]